jgi:hypothetical protein
MHTERPRLAKGAGITTLACRQWQNVKVYNQHSLNKSTCFLSHQPTNSLLYLLIRRWPSHITLPFSRTRRWPSYLNKPLTSDAESPFTHHHYTVLIPSRPVLLALVLASMIQAAPIAEQAPKPVVIQIDRARDSVPMQRRQPGGV